MRTEKQKPLALLVEDDLSLANIFEICIQKAGFDTVVANDGGKAVALLETITPDLFILDLHVPIYSGDQIIDRIKANPRFNHSRIVLATADARMAETLRSQVDFIMDKPISSRQLISLVMRLVPTYQV
ncbi:MAG: two-component system response regulator VicR [Cellvibrionaceae bacterium]